MNMIDLLARLLPGPVAPQQFNGDPGSWGGGFENDMPEIWGGESATPGQPALTYSDMLSNFLADTRPNAYMERNRGPGTMRFNPGARLDASQVQWAPPHFRPNTPEDFGAWMTWPDEWFAGGNYFDWLPEPEPEPVPDEWNW